jgi:hypothetical protein
MQNLANTAKYIWEAVSHGELQQQQQQQQQLCINLPAVTQCRTTL